MAKSANKSILVVDDDPEIVTLLSTRLAKRGYKVSTASDGSSALELVKRDVPDIVLLDVMMPGKSG